MVVEWHAAVMDEGLEQFWAVATGICHTWSDAGVEVEIRKLLTVTLIGVPPTEGARQGSQPCIRVSGLVIEVSVFVPPPPPFLGFRVWELELWMSG